jgi:acyl-CoA reductase-like NAD-dependent aldehyde dehydrogenase
LLLSLLPRFQGVNTYGIWNFTDWNTLANQLRKGYDYGKQRCTAYVRFIVQRSLFPQILETCTDAVRDLHIGNPTLVDHADDALPDLAFGPITHAAHASDLDRLYVNALKTGATPIYEGQLDSNLFLPGQDVSAYWAPGAGKSAAPERIILQRTQRFDAAAGLHQALLGGVV